MSRKAVVVDFDYLGDLSLFCREESEALSNHIDLSFHTCKTEDEIIGCASDAKVVLACGNPKITGRVMKQLKQCKGVIRYGIGVNSIDLPTATDLGIPVYNMPGFCNEELVMHATAMLLAGLRNIIYYSNQIHQGNYPKAKGPLPRRLTGMTVGLLGFGSSARGFAKVCAKGFGANIIAYDPYLPQELFDSEGCQKVSMAELLQKSDVISLHLPLTPETKFIVNRNSISQMKDGVIILNISRGELIKEDDLIAALMHRKIRFAGLDVFEKEPLPKGHPLTQLDNVVLTPHSAFYGLEALETQHQKAAELMVRIMDDNPLIASNLVNKELLETR